MRTSSLRIAGLSAVALLAIVLWDRSGLDVALAHATGGPRGFPLRDDWLLAKVLHTGAKNVAWAFILALCLQIAWPVGALRRLPTSRRVQLAASALVASAVVGLLKYGSGTSCPWDLDEFGGVARHLSHWSGWWMHDGGAGRCFPAGHASNGFAFVGGYFSLRRHAPRLAVTWLACALAAGLVLGVAQQLRGAHFMSHTLWTGWLCWMVGWGLDPLFGEGGWRVRTTAAR